MANRIVLHTGPGVFEVLAHVCRNPQEALKQFVENAADAIDEASHDEASHGEVHSEDSYIHIRLQYEPVDGDRRALKRIAIEDNGTGMAAEKMKSVLQRIGDSEKINLALRGEQGIGLLAFALIAQELHLASSLARQVRRVDLQHGEVARRVRPDDLRLERAAVGQLDADRLRALDHVMVGQQVAV